MKTESQLRQQKLYTLLQDNNLRLSLADLIEYTYHQWDNDYLTIDKACEHILDSRGYMLDSKTEESLPEFMKLLQIVGSGLNRAHKPSIISIKQR